MDIIALSVSIFSVSCMAAIAVNKIVRGYCAARNVTKAIEKLV